MNRLLLLSLSVPLALAACSGASPDDVIAAAPSDASAGASDAANAPDASDASPAATSAISRPTSARRSRC